MRTEREGRGRSMNREDKRKNGKGKRERESRRMGVTGMKRVGDKRCEGKA